MKLRALFAVRTLNGKTTKSRVKVTATELEVTDDVNRTIKYKRM